MIDIYVLNTDFQVVGVVDSYESFIWTDRFYSYGDFEIYTAFDSNVLDICHQDYYVWIKQSDHLMIIEGIEIESDADAGNHLKISGRSLESIIDRRIVWQQMAIATNTKFQDAIKRLLDDAFFAPHPYSGNYSAATTYRTRTATQLAMANKRKISNLIFEPTEDSYIAGLKVEKHEYTGDNLYDIFQDLFKEVNGTVGYKILLNDENQFVFSLYTGVDRSYEQEEFKKTEDITRNEDKTYYYVYQGQYVMWNPEPEEDFDPEVTYYERYGVYPYVVFSSQFDNVINSNYIDNTSDMKNVTLVAGEGTGSKRTTVTVGSEGDLPRREFFTDARDMQKKDYGNNNAKYVDALKKRGTNKLYENSRVTSYEGKVEATRQFVYGVNFNMGDVIQMVNEYGIEGNARVVEWVLSDSADGIETYPTFDAVQIIDTSIVEDEQDEDQ